MTSTAHVHALKLVLTRVSKAYGYDQRLLDISLMCSSRKLRFAPLKHEDFFGSEGEGTGSLDDAEVVRTGPGGAPFAFAPSTKLTVRAPDTDAAVDGTSARVATICCATQASISDSTHATELRPSRTCLGNVGSKCDEPSLTRR